MHTVCKRDWFGAVYFFVGLHQRARRAKETPCRGVEARLRDVACRYGAATQDEGSGAQAQRVQRAAQEREAHGRVRRAIACAASQKVAAEGSIAIVAAPSRRPPVLVASRVRLHLGSACFIKVNLRPIVDVEALAVVCPLVLRPETARRQQAVLDGVEVVLLLRQSRQGSTAWFI